MADFRRNWPGYLLTVALGALALGVTVHEFQRRAERWERLRTAHFVPVNR